MEDRCLTPKTQLKEFLGNFRDPEKASALFADDGAVEMPFFESAWPAQPLRRPQGRHGHADDRP
jgi:hypothetical protein